MIARLIRRYTRRWWIREISGILCQSQAENEITDRQLHILADRFSRERMKRRGII